MTKESEGQFLRVARRNGDAEKTLSALWGPTGFFATAEE